jgi:hypothetical protein
MNMYMLPIPGNPPKKSFDKLHTQFMTSLLVKIKRPDCENTISQKWSFLRSFCRGGGI